jgi:hypothetical protein
MNKQTAAQIVAVMTEVGEKLNDSVRLVRDESSSDSFNSYRDSVGKIMGIMFFDIINPVFEKYPDLKPESFFK